MKKLIVVAVLAGLAVVGGKMRGKHAVDGDVGALDGPRDVLVDQFWIDHAPASERDPINFMVVFSEQKVGIMRNMTAYKGSDEMFVWAKNGWRWPSNGDLDKPFIRITACREDGFDYCMDLSGVSRGVKHYRTKKDWKVRSLADEQALAAKLDAPR
jgi:hypothetical protein